MCTCPELGYTLVQFTRMLRSVPGAALPVLASLPSLELSKPHQTPGPSAMQVWGAPGPKLLRVGPIRAGGQSPRPHPCSPTGFVREAVKPTDIPPQPWCSTNEGKAGSPGFLPNPPDLGRVT